ncbi:MAG TPA: hypothetical protein VHQ01_12220 [Pyrinomonadaceae bacterium]|jgi:hypothetical protein|nr:hypothetical protein [Pyrinomonadaceae bacterium]
MGIGFACGRGGGNAGNQKHKLKIPIGNDDLFPDGSPLKKTEKAIGFMANGVVIWMPFSQIVDQTYEDQTLLFWCPMWLIEEKALEMFIDTSHEPGLFD